MAAGLIIGARFVQYTGALVLFGAPLFYLYAFPSTAIAPRWQKRLVLISAVSGLLGALLWSAAETVAMSDEPGDAMHLHAVWMMLSETRFGLACLARISLLLFALLVLAFRESRAQWTILVVLGSAAIMSFAWTGHGAANIPESHGAHLAADLLHLLAAGIWVGALGPLLLLAWGAKRSGHAKDIQALSRGLARFSAIGIWVVAVLFASGIINCWFLVGPLRITTLFSADYGVVLAVKVGLFAAMLGLAMLNRYRLSPKLAESLAEQGSAAPAVTAFRSSLLVESTIAVMILFAVSVLGILAPLGSGN